MLVTQISEVLFVGRDQARKTDRWADGHENYQRNIAYWYLSDLDLDYGNEMKVLSMYMKGCIARALLCQDWAL